MSTPRVALHPRTAASARIPHAGRRLMDLTMRYGAGALSLLGTVAALGLVTVLVKLTRDPSTALVHLYYLPIIYAAVRYGKAASAATAVAAGALIVPWHEFHAPEGWVAGSEWFTRLVMYLTVGLVVAWLARAQPRAFDTMVQDMVVGRALKAAIRRNQLTVHYQPVISLTDGSVMGVEALCRWFDKHGRPAPPDGFIPVAERMGLICDLGRSVLHQASSQAESWEQSGPADRHLSINVSAVELSNPDFLDMLREEVNHHSHPGVSLCLEITETALMRNQAQALTALTEARAMGLTISLDDFGTGQSSLAYLAGFPIDVVKIDRRFISTITTDPFSRAAVSAVVHLAHVLGAQTVAEGVETEEVLTEVMALGCDYVQGYLTGRPVAAEDLDWKPRSLPAA